MAKKYWFTPNKKGLGFFPETLEGWTATLGLFVLFAISLQTNGMLNGVPTSDQILRFLFDTAVLIVIFAVLFKSKVKKRR